MGGPAMASRERPHDAYPVRTVAQLTGLSADLIRAWERRYGVVTPVRGPRGSRLYTAEDISHLRLLGQVVASGRAIGDVARLRPEELETLAGDATRTVSPRPATAGPSSGVTPLVATLVESIQRLDAPAVEAQLSDALVALGHREFARHVVCPLLVEIGDRWGAGTLSVGAEHLASGLLRNLLGSLIRTRGAVPHATVLLATPSGERHELGVLLVSLLLRDAGLGVHYLGPDVPAPDIIASAETARVAAVGIGVADAGNRTRAVDELRRIELALPPGTDLWLGGREAAAVAAAQGTTRARVVDDLDKLDREIVRVRDTAALRR